MTERMVYGCHKCLAIFRPDFLYVVEGSQGDSLHCPNCGDYALELGYAPGVTMREEGLWYLCDGHNIMGPYPDEAAATADLWAWFGGKPHAEEGREEGSQEGSQGSGQGAGQGSPQ